MEKGMPKLGRLKMSRRSQNLLALIKSKTGLTANVAGRFALCLSLGDQSIPNPEEYDSGGSEIHQSVIYGEFEDAFLALMVLRLDRDGFDPETQLDSMVRAHFNRGTIALFARVHGLQDVARLAALEAPK